MPKLALCTALLLILSTCVLADAPPSRTGPIQVATGVRPQMTGIGLSDGDMQFDGSDSGWDLIRALAPKMTSRPENILFHIPSRGAVTGPQDLSMSVWAAYDSKSLYILADVHDSELFSQCDAANPWLGDDFEVYVDANDPAQQYGPGLNDNDGHYTFIPANVNAAFPRGFLYQAGQSPGIRFSTRLRSFGYTIYCAIPKSLLPNWKLHPDLSSIGFDVQATDVDSPGLIGHDAAEKSVLFLLSPSPHFQTPAKLGTLKFAPPVDIDVFVPNHTRLQTVADVGREILQYNRMWRTGAMSAGEIADDVLAHIEDAHVGAAATLAAESVDETLQRAGAEVYALRPDLKMNAAAQSAVGQLIDPKGADPEDGPCAYALYALAVRHLLKADRLYSKYMILDDPALKLSYVWCLGLSGDRDAIVDLQRAYPSATGELQQRIAWSLAVMGDKTGIALLRASAAGDAKSLWGRQCIALVAKLGG